MLLRIPILLAAKFVRASIRLAGHHGSALPGLIVDSLDQNFLAESLGGLPKGVVVITGTNGKTTTTRMLVQLLRANGLRVLTNASGSNLTRGLTSAVVEHASLSGRLPYDVAVLELDEAYAPIFAQRVGPTVLVALNVMRDQLDRYGETDTTATLIAKAGDCAGRVIINGNDQLLSKRLGGHKHVTRFGLDAPLLHLLSTEANLYAKKPTKHPTAGGKSKALDAKIVDFLSTKSNQTFVINVGAESVKVSLPLEGAHNALNALAAIFTTTTIMPDLKLADLAQQMASFKPAFGRGETINFHGLDMLVALVKNPSGFTQNLRTFVTPQVKGMLVVINDDYADGRDVSWLWDVNIEPLRGFKGPIFVAGTRRYDMALCFKYQGIACTVLDGRIKQALLQFAKRCPGKALVVPTYTAMLGVRRILQNEQGGKHIW